MIVRTVATPWLGFWEPSIGCRASGNISVLFGDGTGKFIVRIFSYEGLKNPRGITATDIDADGSPVRVPVAIGVWSVVTGQFDDDNDDGVGNGKFRDDPLVMSAGQDPEYIRAEDLDQNGWTDLIVRAEDTDDVYVYLNQGDAIFDVPRRYVVGDQPQRFAIGDYDGDGWLDLVVPNRGSQDVSTLLNSGDGTFLALGRNSVGEDPESLIVVDLNGDGRADVVTANRISDDVSVLLGLGNGQFEVAVSYGVGLGPWQVAADDVNGDSRIDLVTVNRFSDTGGAAWRCSTARRIDFAQIGP